MTYGGFSPPRFTLTLELLRIMHSVVNIIIRSTSLYYTHVIQCEYLFPLGFRLEVRFSDLVKIERSDNVYPIINSPYLVSKLKSSIFMAVKLAAPSLRFSLPISIN